MNIYKVSRINSHLKQVSNYLIPVPVPAGFQKPESGTSLVLDPMLSVDCMIYDHGRRIYPRTWMTRRDEIPKAVR